MLFRTSNASGWNGTLKPKIALTVGDPAGIGPEVSLRAAADPRVNSLCTPILVGSSDLLSSVANHLGLQAPQVVIGLDEWPPQDLVAPAVLDLPLVNATNVVPGRANRNTGAAAYQYILFAIGAAMRGEVDAVTTGPVHKEALDAAGVRYPGHTEIFASETSAARACMMLTSPALTCSFATTHVGYRDVPGLLTIDRVRDVIELSANAVQRIHQRDPRLVVCGLNPHAGESGLFGDGEEERIITPAIQQAKEIGFDIVGPLSPDTAFLPEKREETDCFVCMYHDQGHIPLKALAFDVAVNITLGLPIIRTSVDHGTALDIAWQGTADDTSMVQALLLAARLTVDERTESTTRGFAT